MLSLSKSSLVEQKKQQWAREREEMSRLYLPWGSGERYGQRLPIRNQFASSLELHDQSYDYPEPPHRQRSPSLPPIHHNDQPAHEDNRRTKNVLNRNVNTISAKRFSFYDEDGEGDTSGYGSETVNHRGQRDVHSDRSPVIAWQHGDERNGPSSVDGRSASEDVWSSRSPRSATAEEGRPRWGDRGVATGRLWEPTAPTARLPQMPNQKKGTPSWVERGLNMIENTAEVLVIDQRSSNNSGFECDRSSCNGSDEGRTFLRGQNVPIEPEIKAQRENQRIKALELQSAILSQLEDREKRRQEERERKLREERLEEIRLQRQQEEDRLRVEEEQRKNQEKQLQEQRKLDALKKALEDAERNAKLEKEKRFVSQRQSNSHSNDLKSTIENCPEPEITRHESVSPTKSNRTYDIHSARSQTIKKEDTNSHHTTEFSSPRSVHQGNMNSFLQSSPRPLAIDNHQYSIVPIGINGEVLKAPQNCIQLAVIVPQSLSNSLYSVSLNSLNNITDTPEREKLLTPRKYRPLRHKDVSTQTDDNVVKANETEEQFRSIDKEYSNIDENAPQELNSMKKERRFRSEERYKKDLENRPKWGVNRPVAQYKKQSEKDPFYSQKRKLRYKYRTQTRQYISQSSDDSRSPSPPTRSDKLPENNSKHRNSMTQSYWRNKRTSQDFTQLPINSSELVSIVQTETNFGQITANELQYSENKKSPISSTMSPSKRVTLSQKFINDKYGNRKLWTEDVTEKPIKTNAFDTENRKKLIDQLNKARRDLDRNEDQDLIMKTKY